VSYLAHSGVEALVKNYRQKANATYEGWKPFFNPVKAELDNRLETFVEKDSTLNTDKFEFLDLKNQGNFKASKSGFSYSGGAISQTYKNDNDSSVTLSTSESGDRLEIRRKFDRELGENESLQLSAVLKQEPDRTDADQQTKLLDMVYSGKNKYQLAASLTVAHHGGVVKDVYVEIEETKDGRWITDGNIRRNHYVFHNDKAGGEDKDYGTFVSEADILGGYPKNPSLSSRGFKNDRYFTSGWEGDEVLEDATKRKTLDALFNLIQNPFKAITTIQQASDPKKAIKQMFNSVITQTHGNGEF